MKTRFSIIIPVAPYRDAEVLKSLKELEYPSDLYEVVVEKGGSASGNRNKALKKARFEYVLFLDDDAVVPSDLLSKADSFIQEHRDVVAVIGGCQLTPGDDGYFAKTSGYILGSYFGSQTMRFRYVQGKKNLNVSEMHLTTAICFAKKSVLDEVGYFDESLFPGEDPELFARVKQKGFTLAYEPSLFVYHRRRSSYRAYLKQIYLYGKVRLQKEKIRGSSVSLLYLVPLFFFLYMVFVLPFSFFVWWLSLPFLLYLFLAIASSLMIVAKHRNFLSFPVLIFLYFSHHLSYGVGLLSYLFGRMFR